ncbi:hypothetical protein G3N56_13450 [Desulfovibrio sulfodismutans]|uniref:Uncharacterized protein n=1 Tax=Desulfolutivibrio sulfodismutans TaxID=63561 RepID=A0A7K3NNP0_9BACT|nr:hypothetical protein [Desulfolutivibrio sulfodismutans]NDY57737.1 hypothetical protein [Desulfolutivibrio sulfodismutans]QLA11629.1 hypothetical protein GD606_04735 [Desulfolutivibrio sulfodismutans DSM 3696]
MGMLPVTDRVSERAKNLMTQLLECCKGDDGSFNGCFLFFDEDCGIISQKKIIPATLQVCTNYILCQIERDMERFKRLWEDDKNPCFVFEAYSLCREHDFSIPGWVL